MSKKSITEIRRGSNKSLSEVQTKAITFHKNQKPVVSESASPSLTPKTHIGSFSIPNHRSMMPLARGQMPQIRGEHETEFLLHMADHGIDHSLEDFPTQGLKSTQAEFSSEKIKKLQDKPDILKKRIMISKDNYVLDGHHRWLANYNANPNSKQNVIRFSASIKDLLPKAKAFKHVKFRAVDESLLDEGIHDPGIFKAIFLAGGPASGKDFVMKRIIGNFGFVEVSSDPAFSLLLNKHKLSLAMPDHEETERNVVRSQAKKLEQHKKDLVLNGRLGIIMNGTGDDFAHTAQRKKALEDLGYDTMMLFVSVSLETSHKRSIYRHEVEGGRLVPDHIRTEKWENAMANMEHYKDLFGPNFVVVDNSLDIHTATQEHRAHMEKTFQDAYKKIMRFTKEKPARPAARTWMQMQQGFHSHLPNHMESLDQAFAEEILVTEHGAISEAGKFTSPHSVSARPILGVRHSMHKGVNVGRQWKQHHRGSNTSVKAAKIQAPAIKPSSPSAAKTLRGIRKEGATDSFGYDFDTSMGSTAPIGTGSTSPGGKVRYDLRERKPFTRIMKECRRIPILQNTDNLLEDNDHNV